MHTGIVLIPQFLQSGVDRTPYDGAILFASDIEGVIRILYGYKHAFDCPTINPAGIQLSGDQLEEKHQ